MPILPAHDLTARCKRTTSDSHLIQAQRAFRETWFDVVATVIVLGVGVVDRNSARTKYNLPHSHCLLLTDNK
jgi:hypothetical protein